MIFITKFLKSNINYKQPQGQPPPPIKIMGAPMSGAVPPLPPPRQRIFHVPN